jgi:ATP-dependent RNA helicase RhlE
MQMLQHGVAQNTKGKHLKTFNEIELIAPVLRALVDEKYETPTPIQAQTIPPALEGRDILGCAQTGTGKTAAFALPILNRLGTRKQRPVANRPQVLVLAPTRELAIQIAESFATYGRHLQIRCALVYGGVSQASQVRALDRGAHVVVATPGRLLDLMNQGHIDLQNLDVFVLDEADRMLDMGFLPDLKRIIRELPPRRQSLFFSATMPPNIIELSRRLLSDPVHVNVTPKTTSVERIEQRVLFVERAAKQGLLHDTLSGEDVERVLVFTRTKRNANLVAQQLVRNGFAATAIHGNKSQNARQRALDAFRSNKVRVLVATDVAARGIDIDGITHVINFDMPVEAESYVHRIGRTGRAGAAGIALSFCSAAERPDLQAIERLIGQRVPVDPQHTSRGSCSPVESKARPGKRRDARSRPAPALRNAVRGSTRSKAPATRSAVSSTARANRRPRKAGSASNRRVVSR